MAILLGIPTMMNLNVVSKKLRAKRKSLPGSAPDGGMTQAEFADWLTDSRGWKVTQSMVSDWERAEKRISKGNDIWLRELLGMKSRAVAS
jgi:hypothetical protein